MRLRRAATVLALGAITASGLTAIAAPAQAKIAPKFGIVGRVEHAVQARDGSVTVTGWAFRASQPNRHMLICIWSDDACRARIYTRIYRPAINAEYHVRADHGFQAVLPRAFVGDWVTLRDYPPDAGVVSELRVSTPGARIITEARKFVGKSPYRSGGASPSGFDCSGYAMYVYNQADVSSLPHNTQAQRYSAYMRKISYRSNALPGDLIFYLSGGYAYHVAIYAGNGMEYAATQPGQTVRFQHIWSSAIEFRTNWH
jgi:hypothetical protein